MDMMFNTEMIVKDMKGGKEDMTENKRFTMCHEQNDMNGWTMGIVDWETKEPFDYTTYEVHSSSITDTKDEMEDLCLLLNELNDENKKLKIFLKAVNEELDLANRDYDTLEEENEQLKQQKDKWKQQCIHFKEMLDDMDITYLCDEWIYEELKGDVE